MCEEEKLVFVMESISMWNLPSTLISNCSIIGCFGKLQLVFMGTLILITPKGSKILILLGQVINLSISSPLKQTPSAAVIYSVDNNVVELLFNCFFDLINKFLFFGNSFYLYRVLVFFFRLSVSSFLVNLASDSTQVGRVQ